MILKIENLNFSYDPSKPILDNLSLTFEQGKIYAIMGANGSGKSTLFNIITGFIKAQSGNIYFNNKNIFKKKPFQINQLGIGRTFQDLRIITKISVKENILLAMKNNPFDKWYAAIIPNVKNEIIKNQLNESANQLLEKYHLKDVCNSLAGEISYGQQKLLTIACCIANDADVLLLDEPIAGVNPIFREQITQFLKELKQQNKTIIVIEHNTEFISQVADEILFLSNGKIAIFKDLETIRTDKNVLESYL